MEISFFVKVPVLSENNTSIPANSSMAVSLLTMAFFLAIAIAPTVSVTDRTAGCATGIDTMVKTSANPKISKKP